MILIPTAGQMPNDVPNYMTDGQGGYTYAFVFPLGCCTDLSGDSWTFYHIQFETMDDGTTQFCGAVNNIPLRCSPLPPGASQYFADPSSFLQVVEFTTEVLVTPIEISTDIFSPAQVQVGRRT